MKSILKSLCTAFCILALCAGGVYGIDQWQTQTSRRALITELYQAVTHCHAAEGRYPPDLDYLAQHYGICTDDRRFTVEYRLLDDSRFPEITLKSRKEGAWA